MKKEEVKIPKEERRIAYFSMEIGVDSKIPTYSGGLGVLAGDTIKSCADMNVPFFIKKDIFSRSLIKKASSRSFHMSGNREIR